MKLLSIKQGRPTRLRLIKRQSTTLAFQEKAKINITDYESLVVAARQQVEPQSLLFVFLEASLPKDYLEIEKSRFNSSQGGALRPVMCVDKSTQELSNFSALVKESEQLEQYWQIVLIACFSGRNGAAPSPVEIEQSLKQMAETVERGGDLTKFIAFNKSGEPIHFE
ncbi:MAG: ribonucleotide reductase subunit alpha [Gammaproteobacteria bacterium]|nr:ribonucleotide reductase subunit alpha [Gammaproteobacteria bacterium]